MKEMNRREFLTLTGAAVVALSLAGSGGPPAHLRSGGRFGIIRINNFLTGRKKR